MFLIFKLNKLSINLFVALAILLIISHVVIILNSSDIIATEKLIADFSPSDFLYVASETKFPDKICINIIKIYS